MADKKRAAGSSPPKVDEVKPAASEAVPLQVPQAPVPPATVKEAGGWHLVSYGTWQISVGPDGLLMLPRHLHPDEFAHFVACGKVAADIGLKIQAGHAAKAKLAAASETPRRTPLPTRQAILAQGPPPDGTKRMRVTSAQQRSATIGRGKRGRETNTPATPTATPDHANNPTRRRING